MIIVLVLLLTACSDELDRDGDYRKEIANKAADIAKTADEQVNASIAKMRPVNAGNEADHDGESNESAGGDSAAKGNSATNRP